MHKRIFINLGLNLSLNNINKKFFIFKLYLKQKLLFIFFKVNNFYFLYN